MSIQPELRPRMPMATGPVYAGRLRAVHPYHIQPLNRPRRPADPTDSANAAQPTDNAGSSSDDGGNSSRSDNNSSSDPPPSSSPPSSPPPSSHHSASHSHSVSHSHRPPSSSSDSSSKPPPSSDPPPPSSDLPPSSSSDNDPPPQSQSSDDGSGNESSSQGHQNGSSSHGGQGHGAGVTTQPPPQPPLPVSIPSTTDPNLSSLTITTVLTIDGTPTTVVTAIPTYLNTSGHDTDAKPIKPGGIVGIVVAVVGTLTFIVLLAFFIRRREMFNKRREFQKRFLPRSMLREEVDAFDLAESDPFRYTDLPLPHRGSSTGSIFREHLPDNDSPVPTIQSSVSGLSAAPSAQMRMSPLRPSDLESQQLLTRYGDPNLPHSAGFEEMYGGAMMGLHASGNGREHSRVSTGGAESVRSSMPLLGGHGGHGMGSGSAGSGAEYADMTPRAGTPTMGTTMVPNPAILAKAREAGHVPFPGALTSESSAGVGAGGSGAIRTPSRHPRSQSSVGTVDESQIAMVLGGGSRQTRLSIANLVESPESPSLSLPASPARVGPSEGQPLVDVEIPAISMMDDIDDALREIPPRYDMIRRGTSESTIPRRTDDIGQAL